MGTKDFNILDIIIAKWRLSKIIKVIDFGDNVLDFGCGSQAYFLRTVERKINSGIGLDYDAENAIISKNIKISKFQFKDNIPLSTQFDKIVMLAVLEHIELEKTELLFNEFRRLLKPSGRILVTTPTPSAKGLLEFLAFRMGIISKSEILDHKKYYTRKDIHHLGKNTGLTLVSYKKVQFGMNSLAVLKNNT